VFGVARTFHNQVAIKLDTIVVGALLFRKLISEIAVTRRKLAKMGKEEGTHAQPGAQPLTKEDCKKAGMKWDDRANVCGEGSL
jgi:hypothetical protein